MCISAMTLHENKKNCCELPQYAVHTLPANLKHVSEFTQPKYDGHCPLFYMPCLQSLHFVLYAGPHSCVTYSIVMHDIQRFLVYIHVYPDEKDHANTRLARALVSTTRISAEIREILTAQRPVTPKRAGASGSKINDDGISTFKKACSRRYSGSLKLSSRRFEHAQNRSAPFLILFSIAPEVNGLGRCHAVIRAKFGVETVYF